MHLTARGPAALWAGIVVLLPTTVFLGVSVWLDVGADPDGPGAMLAVGGWGAWYALLGTVLAALATVILYREPRQGMGWGIAWLGMFWSLDGLAQSYVRFGIREDHALAGIDLALWFLNRVGSFLPLTAALLLFLFPTGRFLPGVWRAVGWVTVALMALASTVVVLAPSRGLPEVPLPPDVDLDAGTLPLPDPVAEAALPVVIVVSSAGFLVAMLSVVVRYRRSRDLERDRMRWLLWSVVSMAILIGLTSGLEIGTGDVMIVLLMLLPTVAMTIAVVDPELVSIERLLGRTLVYGALAAVILLTDLAALALLTILLDDSLSRRQVVLTVLLVSVLVYAPLRHRLARWVQRLMLGERTNPYDVVADLASTLEATSEGPEQLAAVASAVATAFRVPFVGVEVDRGTGERVMATYGDRPAETRALPIVYRGAAVGRLVLPAKGLRSRLSRRDEQLLGDLVRQAAAAARTSRLAEDLQASRERLVLAREEERRRIRRDLHDGLGPALGGVVFQLESARLLVERDPAKARAQLESTSALVQEVVGDVRRLVHDLRPPALDDRGLVGALEQLAERMSGGGCRTTVEAAAVPALPAAVEVAAYRIGSEALANVTRHAAASRCTVGLAVEDDALVLTVRDDGVGIPDDAEAGVGLVSMRERAAELGGSATVSCPAEGGTLVRAVLPIEEER